MSSNKQNSPIERAQQKPHKQQQNTPQTKTKKKIGFSSRFENLVIVDVLTMFYFNL